ncbi:hypothetical protein WCLP8_1780016 [uncultured Gammaproteobacteria bacterium]
MISASIKHGKGRTMRLNEGRASIRAIMALAAVLAASAVDPVAAAGATSSPTPPPSSSSPPAATQPQTPPAGDDQSGGSGSAVKTTGLPVPRYVSLRSGEVNVRTGPGMSYPVEWVFLKREMPVEITAEFDTWRRIRDVEGSEGWVHQSMLSGRRSVLVRGEVRTLRREPRPDAVAVARVEPGVIGMLARCRAEWCEVDLGGYRGWLLRAQVWGIYSNEKME